MEEYFTLEVPVTEYLKREFNYGTGLDLKEDTINITYVFDGNNYRLYAIDNKIIVYNTSLTMNGGYVVKAEE